MQEFEFINWLRASLAKPSGSRVPVGIGDDMAVVNFCGGTLLFGSDMAIESVHFELAEVRPEQIGYKALARCLSDCAAMAGVPTAALISIASPISLSDQTLKEIYTGMTVLTHRFDFSIVGGDTARSPHHLMIDVALIAECRGNPPILRSGAQPGDTLYVTGPLGGSILGKHLTFDPRIHQARWLAQNLPLHAMIDLSDGLSSDLHHLCRESDMGAEIQTELLEAIISSDARTLAADSDKSSLDHALNDGEDFELLAAIACSPYQLSHLPQDLQLMPVGKITADKDIVLIAPDGTKRLLEPKGFQHFYC